MSAMPVPVLLLVEDEALIVLDVEESLKEAGFEPIAVSEGCLLYTSPSPRDS